MMVMPMEAVANPFGTTWFFGDSLTDSGTFKPFLPPGTGKFTTNPGPVWSEVFARALGSSGEPVNTPGGTNFAQGGARVTQRPGVTDDNPLTANALPVHDQITAYLAQSGGAADRRAIYTVWAGDNDIFRAIDPTKPEAADPVGYLTTTAQQLASEVARLSAAGARYIIVPTALNPGLSPAIVPLGPQAVAGVTALTDLYNAALFASTRAAGVRIIPADTNGMLAEVGANPARYGFRNIDTPACGAVNSLLCTPADLVSPDAAHTYFFADDVHPTTQGHLIIAEYMASLLSGPRQVSLLAEAPVRARQMLFQSVYDHAGEAAERPIGKGRVWFTPSFGHARIGSGGQFSGGAGGFQAGATLGADWRVAPAWIVGLALGFDHYGPRFLGGAGHYDQVEGVIAAYARFMRGPLFATVMGAGGYSGYHLRRAVRLGAAMDESDGRTTGSDLSLSLLGGYTFSGSGDFVHGPIAGFELQRVRVSGFAEDTGPLGLFYRGQNRGSAVGRIGYQAEARFGQITPFGRLSLDHEFISNDRTVTAGLTTVPEAGTFVLPAVQPDRTYGTGVLGFRGQLSPTLAGSVSVISEFGPANLRSVGLWASISCPF